MQTFLMLQKVVHIVTTMALNEYARHQGPYGNKSSKLWYYDAPNSMRKDYGLK